MNSFEYLEKGILRLCVPFDGIYTTVFLLKSEKGTALLDSASYPTDIENYVLPALERGGFKPDILLCSHMHGDHCGGLNALCEAYPTLKIGLISKEYTFKNPTLYFKDGDMLFDRFKILNLKGHTLDSLGVLDTETNTLIACDALQQMGVGKYKPTAESPEEYIKTLDRIAKMKPNRIICSHDYTPFGFSVEGENINRLLTNRY